MKSHIIHTVILFTMLSALTSCLEEKEGVIVDPDDFYQNESQCISALNGCYIPLNSIYSFAFLMATEGVTDLASANNSAQYDAKLMISPAGCGCGTTVWQQCYIGVRNANACVYGIENSPMTDKEKAPLLAEAKVIRAFYYYILTCFFGNIPFYRDYIRTDEDLTRISSLPRMNASETRESLIEELEGCVEDLPQKRTSDIEGNRIGAPVGWMLIAKMSMWNGEWDRALAAIDHLDAIYGDLSQYPLGDLWFSKKNTPESILEIQHEYVAGGIDYTSNCASALMPHPRISGTCTYNNVDIPELGDKATCWSPVRPTAYMRSTIMPANVQDDRRDMNMVSSWKGHDFTSTWMGPKFWCFGMYASKDSNNYPVFRYADAVLMAAECYCETGEYEKAIARYDTVRDRAGASRYGTFKSYIRMIEEIRKERGRELFGEFQRKFDLVRWGLWYQNTLLYNSYSLVQENIRPCHEYYPIPDEQVRASGGALDNNEYAKYGL